MSFGNYSTSPRITENKKVKKKFVFYFYDYAKIPTALDMVDIKKIYTMPNN